MAGRLLVAFQFLLIAALAWPTGAGPPGPVATGLLIAAMLLGTWSLAANRPGNFNIRPDAKPGGQLIERGPYRFVRHPMYVAVLVAAAGLLAWQPSGWHVAAWLALAAVLQVKTVREEAAMLHAHPGYAAYRARTARWVPLLW